MDRFLKNNTILRIIALVMSCILWVGVTLQGGAGNGNTLGVSEKFPYPVRVLVDPNMVVTAIDNPTAMIVVHGDALNVASLPAQMLNVTVQADARGLQPGRHTLQLTANQMMAVNYDIQPNMVTVVIERKVTESKDVRVDVQGSPNKGYTYGSPVTDVQSVEVSGVKSAVDKVAYLSASVSVQGANGTVTKAATLRPVDSSGDAVPGVDVSPSTVTVTVPIQSPQVSSNVVPQIVGTPAAGFAVSGVDVSPTMVEVVGSPDVTANLLAVNVPIDVTGFRADQTVRVTLPLRSGITKITPDTISVKVHIDVASTRTFTDVPITLQNVPSNESAVLSTTHTVSLTVSGPKSLVDALQLKDISVYIDAGRLQLGSNPAPVNVALPDWIQVTDLSNPTVDVLVAASGGSH